MSEPTRSELGYWSWIPTSPSWTVQLALLAGLALLVGLAAETLNPYFLRLGVLAAIYVCLAVSYNLVITEAGQFHLGFVVYFAVGAYAVAIPTTHFGWGFWPALALSVIAVSLFSFALGALLLRFRGDYLSVVSLASAEILRLVAANWRSLTGGYQGLPGVPPPEILGNALYEQRWYLYFAAALAVLTVAIASRFMSGAAGLAWRAIRQNEKAAELVGLQVGAYKQLSFQIAGLFAGLAGGLYASFQTIVDPSLLAIDGTILLLTMVILGGGTLLGLIAAAVVLVVLPEMTRLLDEYRMLFLGALFVLLMNWRPNGFGRKPRAIFHARDAAASIPLKSKSLPERQDCLLEVRNVSRRFGGLLAVADVSFRVHPGEILGIIGPNGAGKTTLFNIIAGQVAPTAGTVLLEGRDLTDLGVARRSRAGIARTFQLLEVSPDLSCLENVLLSRLARVTKLALPFSNINAQNSAVAEALGALEFVGLGSHADSAAGTLSYGDRRRLEIARALASEPKLLLLDEPAAGMNLAEAQHLIHLIRRIRDLGITVIVIEHNVRLVREVSDRIVVLASGKVIADERPDTVLKSPPVIEAYLGTSHHAAH